MSGEEGAVSEVITQVAQPFMAAGNMRVSVEDAPNMAQGVLAFRLRPVEVAGTDIVVFGDRDTPYYLFAGEGPGYEFYEGAATDLPLLERLLRSAVAGRYRWWTTTEQRRALLRPWRQTSLRVTVAEWSLNDGPLQVRHYFGEPWLPPAGQALPYPTGV